MLRARNQQARRASRHQQTTKHRPRISSIVESCNTAVAWQHPANNWGDQEGGYDLTGATHLEVWARGEYGVETIDIGLIGQDKTHPDSAKITVEDIGLKKEWTRYRIRLKKLDLSSIKTGFVVP